MKRAEAIQILSRIWGGNPQHDLANSYADAFVALGILKLDEPLSKDQRVARILGEFRHSMDGLNGFMNRLEAAGLKIVEK